MAEPDKKAAVPKRGRLVTVLVVAALFLIGTIQALTGSRGYVTAEVDDQHLGVSGTYGTVFIELDKISGLQLVDSFDFGSCIEGEQTKNTISGVYSCEQYAEYTVHAYSKSPSCIIVHSPEGVLVFNCGSVSQTEKMYDRLAQATGITA